MKWDDLALIFEWSFERDRIRELIKTKQNILKTYHIQAIEEALNTQLNKFDMITIQDFINQAEIQERPEDT